MRSSYVMDGVLSRVFFCWRSSCYEVMERDPADVTAAGSILSNARSEIG